LRRLALTLLVIVIGGTVMASSASAADPKLELAIIVAKRGGENVIALDGSSRFQVALTNRSGKPVKIWEDSNSWGHAALRFEISKGGGGKAIVRKKERDWRKNVPTFWTIEDGGRVVYEVDLGSDEWEGLPKDVHGKTVAMRAVIEISEDEKSREFGVWTGRVASPEAKYLFD